MNVEQLPMEFAAQRETNDRPGMKPDGRLWLGLVLDHRTLFEALQDDWLRPAGESPGRTLGVRAFATESPQSSDSNRILVRLKFDPERLPRMPVYHHRAGEWSVSLLNPEEVNAQAVYWPGPLPTFAISELLVTSDEERSRLAGLARQVSNVPLPASPNILRPAEEVSIPQSSPPYKPLSGIGLPPEMDAVRGAMAMAMWAVPRVDPWLDLLCASLGRNQSKKLATLGEYLRSPWWVSPPWNQTPRLRSNVSPQERLWTSSMRAFQRARTGSLLIASELAHQVAIDASRDMPDLDVSKLNEWAQETIKVLRGEARLDLSDWKAGPVGKAIQLVLLRPDPVVFKKWKDDLPLLPPAVWWSAASLCGLLHGYRRLPTSFRGNAEQQRLFAILALSLLNAVPDAENWTALVKGKPEWHRQSSNIILSWSGTTFAQKPENTRGKWFAINLDDVTAKQAAEEICRSNGWACIGTNVTIPGGDIPFSGAVPEVIPAPQRRLTLHGPTKFILPLSTTFESSLDVQEFKRCIATEGATVPPPDTQRRMASSISEGIPGLVYISDFLTETQEAELVAVIDKGEWSRVLKRRVQHYGWRYDYKSRGIDAAMRLGPLPEWAMELAKRLKAEGLLPHLADQVIVNEYIGSQGIGKHIDCVPCFDDGVAMISLLESWEMIFREARKDRRARVPKLLERRSVAIMTGDVRYHWSHEIPARSTEPGGLQRHRRVSVTFRKVLDAELNLDPTPRRSRKRRSV